MIKRRRGKFAKAAKRKKIRTPTRCLSPLSAPAQHMVQPTFIRATRTREKGESREETLMAASRLPPRGVR
jgi:hypothetical protein